MLNIFDSLKGMTRDDLLKINAKIVQDLTTNVAQTSPKAMIALVTNPVNMTTVIACETFNKLGLKDTSKIFGVSTLDIMRGSKFVAELNNVDPSMVFCPIIGGHSPDTMVPLYSQAVCSDGQCLTNGELATEEGKNKMTQRIQQAGTAVVEAKKNVFSSFDFFALHCENGEKFFQFQMDKNTLKLGQN